MTLDEFLALKAYTHSQAADAILFVKQSELLALIHLAEKSWGVEEGASLA